MRAAGIEVHSQSAARQNFGIERLEKSHVDGAIQTKIEFLRTGQVGAAVGGEIGATSGEMQFFDDQHLIRDFQANRSLALDLDIVDLHRERLQFGSRF